MKKFTLMILVSLLSFCGYSQQPGLPLEGFETGWTLASTGTSTTAWFTVQNNVSTNITWIQGNANNTLLQPAYEGERAAFLQRQNVVDGTTFPEDYLVTPEFEVPQNPELHFYSRLAFAEDQGSIYKIFIINLTATPNADLNSPASYTEIQSWTELEINPIQTNYYHKIVAIPDAYIGAKVRIAFMMVGDEMDRWLIDNVEVVKKCSSPTTLGASTTINSADLTWENPSGATKWDIELSAQDANHTGIPTATYTGTLPYHIPGLDEDKCYQYYVRARCDDGGKSDWTGPFIFCTKKFGDTCEGPITVVTLPFLDTNNTQNFLNEYQGSPGLGCGDDSGEDYLSGNDVVYKYTATFTGLINIDLTNVNPLTGIFIFDSCADIGLNCLNGAVNDYLGEDISLDEFPVTSGQDYYIVISNLSELITPYSLIIQVDACDEPVGLPVQNIQMNSAELSWTNPSGANSWQVVVQTAGSGIPPGVGTIVTDNTNYLWEGLAPSTLHEYWVRADCNNGTFSAWAGPYLFNTMICEATNQCSFTFTMWDTWNSWDTHIMTVKQNGLTLATLTGPGEVNQIEVNVPLCNGIPVQLFWGPEGDLWVAENVGISIKNSFGQTIYTKNFGEGFQNTMLYEVLVDCDQPYCLAPESLTATNITQTTADLGWAGSTTGEWEYYIVEAGQPAPTNEQSGTNTTTNPSINVGLPAPSTNYEYYVRMVCEDAESGYSPWSGAFAFSSSVCDPSTKCNYQFVLNNNLGWGGWRDAIMTVKQNGANVAVLGSTFTEGGIQTITVPLCNGIPFEIFWNVAGLSEQMIGLTVINKFGQTIFDMLPGSNNPNTLIYTGEVNCEHALCIPPTGLTASNATTTTIDLAWDGFATGTWEYVIIEASLPAPTASTQGIATSSNPTIAAPLAAPATNYNYYVRLVCTGADSATSDWGGPYAIHSEVCDPADKCTFFFELKSNYGVGYEGNTIAISQAGVPVTILGSSFNWGDSQTIEVALCPNEEIKVVWQETGEAPETKALYIYSPFLENIYVKNFGEGAQGDTLFTEYVSCNLPTCPKPTNLTTEGIGISKAKLSWTETGTATEWEIYVVKIEESNPTTTTIGIHTFTNPYLYELLEPNTMYKYYVRALCEDNDKSRWSGPFPFNSSVCEIEDQCSYDFILTDLGNDGWNNNRMNIVQSGLIVTVLGSQISEGGGPVTVSVPLCPGVPFDVFWVNGSTSNPPGYGFDELGLKIVNPYNDQTIFERLIGTPATNMGTTIYTGMPSCAPITCIPPSNLVNESIGNIPNATQLSWTPEGTELQWEVLIQSQGGEFPTNTSNATTHIVNEPKYTEVLIPGELYEYYVRAICDTDDKSFWSGPLYFSIFTPPACAGITIVGPSLTIVDPDSEYILCPRDNSTVKFSASYFEAAETTSYAIESIPYSLPFPTTGGTKMDITEDDLWAPVAELPFKFCFFGEVYNKAQVGSNGLISFNADYETGDTCRYYFDGLTIPNTSFPIKNAIYGVYQDIDVSAESSLDNPEINYQVIGTYPCRAFVVNFSEIAQFGPECHEDINVGAQTSQIVIYEITNIIEVYVKNRVACVQWKEGEGVLGIQNAEGTLAFTPPNRNTGDWSAQLEAWRFVPNGASSSTLEWLKNGTLISNEKEIEIIANATPATMTARATYNLCNGDVVVRESNFVLKVQEIITADLKDLSTCGNDEITTFNLNDALVNIANPTDYIFTFYATQATAEAGGETGKLTSLFETTVSTIIWVRIMKPGSLCYITKSFNIIISNTPLEFTITPDYSICAGDMTPHTIEVTPIGFDITDATYEWTLDGNPLTDTTHSITAIASGVYVVTINKNGCFGTATVTVTSVVIPVVTNLEDVIVCDSYTLPVLTSGNYFEQPGGVVPLSVGEKFTSTKKFYIYVESGTTPNCTAESSFTVTIIPTAIIVTTQGCEGNEYTLEVLFDGDPTYSPDNTTIEWTNNANAVVGTKAKLAVTETGIYTVTVTPNGGIECPVSDDVIVDATTCIIPRGISPNKDGKNDNFDLSSLNVKHLSVFNRYGKEVYKKDNYKDEFNGQGTHGDDLPTGTYFYMIEREGGESITGWVYINRNE